MLQCFAIQTAHVYINGKHGSVLFKYDEKCLPKRESNLANVQSCPSNEKREYQNHVNQTMYEYTPRYLPVLLRSYMC